MIEQVERLIANHRGLVTAALVILTTALLVAVMPRAPSIFDEGLILMDAQRVLAGEIPHRDFYTNYGPGQPYSVAAVLAIFGPGNLLAARVFGVVTMALSVGLGYLLVSPHIRPLLGLFVAGIAVLWVTAGGAYLYPIYPCMIFIFLSALLLMRPRAIEERWPVFLAGACTGVIALFRYDTGFFVLLAQVLFILFDVPRPASLIDRARRAIFPAFLAGIGSALAFFPFAISFLMVAPLSAFLRDIVEVSMMYAEMRGKPFPGIAEIFEHNSKVGLYFPFLIVFVAAADLIFRRRSDGGASGSRQSQLVRLETILAIFTGVLIYKGLNRVEFIHMMIAIVPGVFLAGTVAQRWLDAGRMGGVAAFGLMAVTIFPALAYGGFQARKIVREFPDTTLAWMVGIDQPQVDCPQDNPTILARDYEAVSRYLARYVPEDERILVGTDVHDRILVNTPVLYAQSVRKPASLWAQYDPGVQTTAPIQKEMIGELEKHKVRWIVRTTPWPNVREPNLSSISSGVTLLDDYLAQNFRPVARAEAISIWLRKGERPPTIPAGMKCMPKPLELPLAAQ